MYVVACKWIANGTVKYKTTEEILSSVDITDDQINWVAAGYAYAAVISGSSHFVNYVKFEDPESDNVITMTFYDSLEGYESIFNKPETIPFIQARTLFLSKTGLVLEEVKQEIASDWLLTSPNYAVANALFTA